MPLPDDFPLDPHAIISPTQRFIPEGAVDRADLVPPLVPAIRDGVTAWRAAGYPDVSETTRALLHFWFNTEHVIPTDTGVAEFRWYFAQREAVESTIWLYEHEHARDPYGLMAYDRSGRLSRDRFIADWPHYTMKLATGSGKTKVLSLLLAWSYFHALYETDSPLSTNILLIAPNIIVFERLKVDFEGGRIFFTDPILPPNGFEGRDWQADFQIQTHLRDEIGSVRRRGNLFLTNIHRVAEGPAPPSFDDADTTDYFLGPKPVTKTTDSTIDLGLIVRQIDDLLIFNDEAHHVRRNSAWLRYLRDIVYLLRQRDGRFGGQFDVSATPKDERGVIFANTVSDYPLVEAIRQRVVKKPVVPDEASRKALEEENSIDYITRFSRPIELGVVEWRKYQAEMEKAGRNAVLFIMTDETRNCDSVAEHLRLNYPELSDGVLVIHTKPNGDYYDGGSKQKAGELDMLRAQSRSIDEPGSPIKAVVSVMMLREGWDVQSVCVIVGLRSFTAQSEILPEQTLGRGLRRMFRGDGAVTETLSVIGTRRFIEFVEEIRAEGVELDAVPMGENAPPQAPISIYVETGNPAKNIAELDIAWPILSVRTERDYRRLDRINVSVLPRGGQVPLPAGPDGPSEIVFRDIDTGEVSHITTLGAHGPNAPEQTIAFFTQQIRDAFRLVHGSDILFGKIKDYIETRLFDGPGSIDDADVMRALAQPVAVERIRSVFHKAVHEVTLVDNVAVTAERWQRLSDTRPYPKAAGSFVQARKSVFNKVVGDNAFETDFAAFLEHAPDVTSFAKNDRTVGFQIEYASPRQAISTYFPDFLVKTGSGESTCITIVETKGQADVDVAPKRERLRQWCADASNLPALDMPMFNAVYVDQARWELNRPKLRFFAEVRQIFEEI